MSLIFLDWLQLSDVLGPPRHHHGHPGAPRHLQREEEPSPALATLVTQSSLTTLITTDIFLTGRYLLEIATYSAVVVVFIVFTQTCYILPLLLKTILTVITWINVKRIYNNSFGTFYTKSTEAIIY